jgi:type VI secretion system protein ImpF
MPLRDGRMPVVTSVLDRLTAAPASGAIGSIRPGTLAALSLAVQRDLEHLLNTRREEELIPAEYHAASASLLNFGLPDPTFYSLKSPADQQRMRRSIESALQSFEPRLGNVTVTIEGFDEVKPVLHFRVEAVLKIEPAPEPIAFDTEFRLDSGQFALKGHPR